MILRSFEMREFAFVVRHGDNLECRTHIGVLWLRGPERSFEQNYGEYVV